MTAFGISAGSASVHHHILTGDPMFDRGICMSGSAPTLGPLRFERYDKAWQTMCKRAGLVEESPQERLEKLRAMSPLDVLKNYSTAALGPMADGVLLPKSWTFEQPNPTRCQYLIVGDTNVEGIIMDGLARRLPPSRFDDQLRSVLSSIECEEFCRLFSFSADDAQPWERYRDFVRRFLSVMMFQFPNMRIAETFAAAGGSEAYLYHFEEPSPYPGPTLGLSYHGQCALYMYCVENGGLPLESQRVAETMGLAWAAFAHGITPWEPYVKSNQFMRFGPEGKIGLKDMQTDETRQYEYLSWLREHFEPLKELTQTMLKGE